MTGLKIFETQFYVNFLEDFSRMESNWTLFILKLQLSFRLSLLCPVEDIECYCCGPNLEDLNKMLKCVNK